jgi:hypothetical protein
VKRPDLAAVDSSTQRYIIEIKTKQTEQKLADAYRQQLSQGKTALHKDAVGRKNTISNILKDAAVQLNALASTADLRIVWMHATGWDTELQYRQIRASLYGSTNLIDLSDEKDSRECLFFGDSDFFRLRGSIDTVVLTWRQSAQMLINHYSPRVQALRKSELRRSLGTAVVDPIELEATKRAYLADCAIPRTDSKAVLEYVKKKYNRPRLADMHWRAISLTTRLPDSTGLPKESSAITDHALDPAPEVPHS